MKNNRLNDQLLILQGIKSIRTEFKTSVERGDSFLVYGEIMVRLATMYSLINTDRLIPLVEQMDMRESVQRKKAA